MSGKGSMKLVNKLKGMFFFTFADGEYSDYCVTGLYVCDHAISLDEWHEHLKQYREASNAKKNELMEANPQDVEATSNHKWLRYDTPSYKVWANWTVENDPDKTFQEKHGMIALEYKELHQGD